MKRILCIAALLLSMVALTQAQEPGPSQEEIHEEEMSDAAYYALDIATGAIPILLLGAILLLVLRKATALNRPYIAKAQEHMDAMEQRYDRIIELMEKIVQTRE